MHLQHIVDWRLTSPNKRIFGKQFVCLLTGQIRDARMRRRISLRNSQSVESAENQPQRDYQDRHSDGEMSVFDLGTILLKKRRSIIWPVITVIFVAAVALLLTPNRYASTVTILPSGKTDKLSALKSLAGVGTLIDVDEGSSELFPEILTSRAVKDALLSRTFSYVHEGKQTASTIQDYFGEDDRDLLYRSMDEITDFTVDRKTGVIRLTLETRYPGLSQALLAGYVEELENFNLHKRRSQARENEKYLASQLELKQQELAEAERRLEQFRMENRNWNSSSNPEIVHELTRLEREAAIKSAAYLYLTQEYEMARFEARKDVPIVRLLDTSSLPTQKSGPYRTMILALLTFTTLMVTVFAVIVTDSIRRRSRTEHNDAYRVFRAGVKSAFPKTSRAVNRLRLTEKEPV